MALVGAVRVTVLLAVSRLDRTRSLRIHAAFRQHFDPPRPARIKFGSASKGQDRPDSDLDLLVDLPAGTSLLRIVGLQLALEDALGIKVDLCTERELDPQLKDRILAEARPV